MAIRNDFTAGEVLAAADLNDTFASKVPYAYGTATPSTTVDGFVWYDENETPPAPKFWDGAAFQAISAPSGLVHIATESFSAVSSVSLNGCFTSAYETYAINIYVDSMSAANPQINMRLRASATDAATNYFTRRLLQSSTTVSGSDNVLGTTLWFVNQATSSRRTLVTAIIDAPFRAQQTSLVVQSVGSGQELFGNYQSDTSSYDGFTIFPDSGNITGTIRVYGYANS